MKQKTGTKAFEALPKVKREVHDLLSYKTSLKVDADIEQGIERPLDTVSYFAIKSPIIFGTFEKIDGNKYRTV